MSVIKHESEKDHTFDDDNRRVSFSFSRTKKLDMAETKLEDSDSPDAVDFSVPAKQKKKWKIKLPWKQKKQQTHYDFNDSDEASDKGSDSDSGENSKKRDKKDSDIDKDVVNESSKSSPPSFSQKVDRPTTWHEGFRPTGSSADSLLDSRTKSIEIPRTQITEKIHVESSLPSYRKDKQYDDVDFIPASSSLNTKRNKPKGKKFRLNLSAFSKPSHTYENTQLKLSESGEKELSLSETSSISDISKIPLSDNQSTIPNSSLIDTDAHEKSKIETSEMLSSPKLASNVTRVVPPYKKSSSLPSFFKRNKKKREFDFKASPPAKGYSSNIQTISSHYPQEQSRNDKTASDSELHHNTTFMYESSGLHSSIQRKKRRSTRGIYKMSRSSFIADSSGSKSLDNLNRNTASEYVDKKETSLKKNVDKDFKSLHDIDMQSKSNSSFQRRPNSGRYTRDKSNFHKSDSYDLSSSDESPERRFDEKFKADYALKLQQISTTSKSQKKISSDPSNSNKEPEHNIKLEKQTGDQSRKLDEFTEFIKSYSSSKSAKISVGSQRKPNKNLNRSAEELEREEREVHSNEKIVAQLSSMDDFTKHQKISISDIKDKSERDKEIKNCEIPVSDKGTLEHSDNKLNSRTKKLSESSTEKSDITESIKHNNSGKHSILKNSLKREAQRSKMMESLNNKTNSDSNKPVEKQRIKTNGAEIGKNTMNFPKEIPHNKECYKVASLEHTNRIHSPHREKASNRENIPSNFTEISTDRQMESEPIFEKVNKKQSAHINYNKETVPTMRVRRRSYEEMTSLIEEQMFDSESEGESQDTDGDEVDLSFGRKKIDPNKKDDDFKLCIVTEKGTFNGTELVYEPKILPKKEELLPIPISKTNNDNLKRPNEAPPVPPNSSEEAHKSDKNTSESQNTLMKGETEKVKRKKLRKTQRRRSASHSSESDTSIEDANGTLYEKYSSKTNANEDSHKRNPNQPSMTTEKDHIDSSYHDIDCDSPPAFPPPVPPPAEDSPPIHTNYIENTAETSHQPINKLTSTSATTVARNLYIQREERNNLIKNNIPNFTVKNSKPMPETKPPPLTTFSTSYNPKNFTPKYEYAPNLPSVPPSANSKRQPITCYSPPIDDGLGVGTDKLNMGEKYKTFENIDKTTHRSFQNQGLNSNFRYVQNQFSSNVVTENQIYDDKSNVENPMHVQNSANEVTLLGELSENPLPDSNNSYVEGYSRFSSVSAMNSDNEFVVSKKHFVTFDLPQHEKYIDNTPSYNLQYRDIPMYEEKNNQKSVSRNDNSSYRPWPNNVYPYHLNLNAIPKSSSIIRGQVLSTQQDMINAPVQREEMYKNLDITSNKNHPHQVYQSSTYPRNRDRSHDRYISVSSPVPYSKQERHLKSILKSNYKREEHTVEEPTQPSLVQTNVKYIQPVIREVRSDFIRIPNKQSIPVGAKNSTAYNTNIERVEITEDSSNSEPEHPPPTPPSYPPPLPRQTWHHQQQKFLGGLLHTESNPNTSFYTQQSYDHSSYYTPTIIEVEAHRGESLERESVYQNVIHASQV